MITPLKPKSGRNNLMPKLKPATILKSKVPFKSYLLGSFILTLITIAFIVFSQGKLPPEVPLFYGAAEGEAQIASSWMLIIPSVFSIFTILTNFVLATIVGDEFIKKVLVISALIVTLFSVVTTFKIIFLVG